MDRTLGGRAESACGTTGADAAVTAVAAVPADPVLVADGLRGGDTMVPGPAGEGAGAADAPARMPPGPVPTGVYPDSFTRAYSLAGRARTAQGSSEWIGARGHGRARRLTFPAPPRSSTRDASPQSSPPAGRTAP